VAERERGRNRDTKVAPTLGLFRFAAFFAVLLVIVQAMAAEPPSVTVHVRFQMII
jgi:hypothetical protein